MIYRVHMTAFGKPGEIREVEVPDGTHGPVLDNVFYYGQNIFQPKPHPSVSMGDVLCIGEELYLVQGIGFKRITKEEFDKYLEIPRRDRIFAHLD